MGGTIRGRVGLLFSPPPGHHPGPAGSVGHRDGRARPAPRHFVFPRADKTDNPVRLWRERPQQPLPPIGTREGPRIGIKGLPRLGG